MLKTTAKMSSVDKELVDKNRIEQKQINEKQVSYEDFTEDELEFLKRPVEHQRWYEWFSKSSSEEEKRLIVKLDIFICLYLFLSSFVKTLDSTAVTYAYVWA